MIHTKVSAGPVLSSSFVDLTVSFVGCEICDTIQTCRQICVQSLEVAASGADSLAYEEICRQICDPIWNGQPLVACEPTSERVSDESELNKWF